MTQDHYFSARPAAPSRPATARLSLPDLTLNLTTDRGVFAYGAVDRGTELLLRTVPSPPAGDLLDLGCGYGPIAIALALRNPAARVWAIDVNERAIGLCRQNAEAAGATNVHVAEPTDVPTGLRFAALYSNPPVRLGKSPLRELLEGWLNRLLPDGRAYLVVQRHLGSDSLAKWLGERGYTVDRLRSRAGYRVLEVHTPTASTHHGAP
jgi:16S rRNA (guanine1207-N2)-methyltransferase